MRYRSRTEIVTRILEVANEGSSSFGNGGVSQTTIMFKASQPYPIASVFNMLTESNLLRHDKQTHTFKTTEKGLSLLKAYN